MIAYNLFSKHLDKEVYEILPQMLVVEPSAKYYSVNRHNDCRLYFPTLADEKEIEKGSRYTYHKINGKLYNSIGTNKIDYWLKRKQENMQLTLF